MSLRNNAEYIMKPIGVKVIPLNADFKTPLPLAGGSLSTLFAIGGLGTFDYSGVAAIAAVEFKIKINETEDAVTTIDLSGAAVQSAVTAAELVAAITAAGYTGVTASVDSRGYVKINVTTPGTDKYIQVYGEGAEIAEFGQGYGLEFVKIDTQQSISNSPTNKDAENITITDSNGLDTEVISDSYRKGFTGTLTDTARDPLIRQIIEGGVYDATNDFYQAPNSGSSQKYFAIEAARALYTKGTNKEGDLVGYVIQRFYTCVGSLGDDPGDRSFAPYVYNLIGTEYKDPETGTIYGDYTEEKMTKAAFDALDWWNI